MAKLIPSLNSCLSKMQTGEKRFARRLEQLLEDDYLCWYEMPVGKKQRYTDFIILHPLRGLLLLEIKDWKIDTIQSINRNTATLNTATGQKTVSNPLIQAKQCCFQLINQLEEDPQLVNDSGDHKGKLVTPYGYGVVLSNITRRQFNLSNLGEVLPSNQVICKDEMTENSDSEEFQKRFWDMFIYQFNKPLSLPQIDRIRWHLFPEVRIGKGFQNDIFAENTANKLLDKKKIVPEIIKVMDMQQEQLARSIGNGHRVIHGVAGSGKTLILGYRSLYLAQTIEKPILVLCFNITLAAQLRQIMVNHGITDKVNVYHFHEWCGEQLTRYHIDKPTAGPKYTDRLVDTVINATESGHIPNDQYGAIMVDEGHDFQPEWLKLISSMVNPETDSLLLLYDDAQSIYNNKKELDFSLSSVNIQARGRTTILRVNYRNTDEIVKFAYQFASHHFQAEDSDEDHVPLIEPKSAGRKAKEPAVMVLENSEQEIRYIIHAFKILNSKYSIPWADMCVTCQSKWMGEKIQIAFISAGVPSQWLGNKKMKKNFNPNDDSVTIITMHSSKGLEFPVVAVAGVGYMPRKNHNKINEAKLLYVALTRSTEKLLVTSHKENDFIKELNTASIKESA